MPRLQLDDTSLDFVHDSEANARVICVESAGALEELEGTGRMVKPSRSPVESTL